MPIVLSWSVLCSSNLKICLMSPFNNVNLLYCVSPRCNAMLQDIELSMFLAKTFRARYEHLISKGLNTMTGEEVLELSCKLSAEEQQLFDGGRASIVATQV